LTCYLRTTLFSQFLAFFGQKVLSRREDHFKGKVDMVWMTLKISLNIGDSDFVSKTGGSNGYSKKLFSLDLLFLYPLTAFETPSTLNFQKTQSTHIWDWPKSNFVWFLLRQNDTNLKSRKSHVGEASHPTVTCTRFVYNVMKMMMVSAMRCLISSII